MFTRACATLFLSMSLIVPLLALPVHSSEKQPTDTLRRAVLCEGVQDGQPVNQTVVFSASRYAVFCWSDFEPVHRNDVIFHEWYRKGQLVSRIKLAVHPPRWSVYSSLRIRQADVGPWHVAIVDAGGHVFQTLRFSITE